MVMAGTDINTKAETYHDPRVNRLDRNPILQLMLAPGVLALIGVLGTALSQTGDQKLRPLGSNSFKYSFHHPVRTEALKPTQQRGQLRLIVACLGPNSKALGSTDLFFSLFHFKQHKLSFPVETGSLPPFPITQTTHLLSERQQDPPDPSFTVCVSVCPFSCPHHLNQVSRMKLCGRRQQSTE